MSRLILLAPLLALLAGCASSTSEINSSLQSAMDCMHEKAPKLDDHTSDATAVAYGLVGACSREINQAEGVAGQGTLTETYDNYLKPRLDAHILKAATEIVLLERSNRSAAQ
jgi:hypothetical protein